MERWSALARLRSPNTHRNTHIAYTRHIYIRDAFNSTPPSVYDVLADTVELKSGLGRKFGDGTPGRSVNSEGLDSCSNVWLHCGGPVL